MAQIELTKTYVTYQSQTRLLELGVDVASSRSIRKVQEKFDLAVKIRLFLKALQYSEYLEKSAIDRLVYTLNDLADCSAIPYAPVITTVDPPSIVVGLPGSRGLQGERGEDGGGTDFGVVDFSIDTVVDSFDINNARAARWEYNLYGDDGQRAGTIRGAWSADGSDFGDDGDQSTEDIYGDTGDVSLSVFISGSTVQLLATVSGGTWTLLGSRYFTPNNGSGINPPTSLSSAKLWVGSSGNLPVERTISGDVTISNTGVAAIATGVIVNADINAAAAISVSKLEALTASRAVVTSAGGVLTTSTTTATEIGYLSGATSNIQTQINAIAGAGTITGAITPYVTSDATASRVIISNPAGKFTVSNVTSTELGYLSGVTSAVQTQLSNKVSTSTSGLSIVRMAMGDWNLATTESIQIASGIPYDNVISVEGFVRSDVGSLVGTTTFPIYYNDGTNYFVVSWSSSGGNALITIRRSASSTFLGTSFDSTGYNRGYITITYTV
jgi:hypothetical protein